MTMPTNPDLSVDQLAAELNLTYPFIIGTLELILHGIKQDYFEEDGED